MRRLRKAVIQFSRLTGPALGATVIVLVAGLGLHAARDWHRHGEIGAGFFHLHFHVGDHEHGNHAHDHPARDDRHRDPPNDEQNGRSAVLTLAHALHNPASTAPVLNSPESTPDRAPTESVALPRAVELPSFANPRAPPA